VVTARRKTRAKAKARAKPRALPEPRLSEMPAQPMAVVYTRGDPATAAQTAIPALFGAAYGARAEFKKRRGKVFKVGPLRARWPDANVVARDRWTGVWGLPLPAGIDALPQKNPDVTVKREVWEYGPVAELLHVGSYATEGPTVARLHAFVTEQGYEIAGPHEEEYLTTPRARVQKTLIRFRVRRAGGGGGGGGGGER